MALGTVNVGSGRVDKNKYVERSEIGVPGGIAMLNADGKLSEFQMPDIDHYTQEETDEKISDAVAAHNTDESAHGDIRSAISELNASIQALDLKYVTKITENQFTVTFASLEGLVVTGVWNADLARIEF